MVLKDQNRNEWKMPLELFGSFVRESFSVLRTDLGFHERRRVLEKSILYEISALRNDWREPRLLLVGAGPESDETTS